MPKKIVFNQNQINELKSMMDDGIRQADIAKHFKVTDDTIRRICRENNLEVKMPHKCKCVICGDTFYSNVKGAKTCKKQHHCKCSVCGKDFIVDKNNIKDTCSPECTSIKKYGVNHPLKAKEVIEKRKATLNEKYGVDNVSQLSDHNKKSKQTCLDKYGATSYAGSEIGRAKTRATNLSKYGYQEPFGDPEKRAELDKIIAEKYGTKWAMQNLTVQAKARATSLERYGFEYPMQNPVIQNKLKKSITDKYGVPSLLKVPYIREKVMKDNMDKFGVPGACMRKEARNFNARSKINKAFEKLLSDNKIEFEVEFPIESYSYDFKCNDILIEIDPTITHNSSMSIFKNVEPKPVNYHVDKSTTASKQGLTCIHIFDWDDWNSIVDIVKSKQAIYARNCTLHKLDRKTAEIFTSKYHLQGSCRGQNIAYGLYLKGELVEVMSFGKPRYNKNYDFELLRLCTTPNINVVGGASKLFKQFVKDNPDKSILSYCDYAKFTGTVYEKMGMKLDHITSPAKVWSKGTEYVTDNYLRQRGYDQIFKANYGKGTSNEKLMLENGWLPVYDCGQKVFVYKPNKVN